MPGLFWIVPISGVLTVLFVIWLARNVLSRDTGTPKMKEIGDMIFQGAWAFLKRQYTTIAIFSVILAIIIGVLVAVLGGNEAGLTGMGIGWAGGAGAFGGGSKPEIAPHLIVGFGFGASFVALFAQLGGGIYTKAADVGADLVGKVESGIPAEHPRPAARP